LVSNAIKFTAQGEVIVRVMVEESASSRHHLRISVSDTGIGLSRTAKADLFQAFQQGDLSVSRQFGGTGLGLVIAKNLVALMEGQIGFDETQEKGSTFWFDFKAGVVAEPEQQPVSLAHKQVLLLERHEASRKLMTGILSRSGADVMTPGDWSALNEALARPCDALIISGNNLPKDAAEELARVRECFGGLIIVLTRACDNNLDPAVFERLHISTLSKPIRPRQLTTLLAQGFSVARIHFPAHDTPPLAAKSSGLRILAVDDHPANLKLVCTLLEDLGIEAVAAGSGMEAVTRAAEENFDLIFMDIQMPGMSGMDATRAIRDQEREGRRVPIIALTAHALADERDMMLREGMNDYLTKPLQEEQLVRIIQRWTGVILQETPWSDHPVSHPAAQPVDWRECLQLAAGKADLARDMLDMLLDSLAPLREKMEQAVSQRNYAALLSHTHYLHGATRYCGVPQLRTATGNLETRLKVLLKEPSATDADLSGELTALMAAISELEAWRREADLPA
jgi:two-component system sensor histidine kinase BarA